MKEEVLYFSLNPERKNTFYDYIKGMKFCYEKMFSFRLIGENLTFNDPRDLLPIIEENKWKDSLHIIIDYMSCCNCDDTDNYPTVIRDIIMAYPEVQFLFDETFVTKTNGNWCFLNFLFQDARDNIGGICVNIDKEPTFISVLEKFHQFDLSDYIKQKDDSEQKDNPFILLLKGRNNMYDGSNLRCAIKAYKFDKQLHVQNNFIKLATSRSKNLAVVVDEEYHQAMFNGYCLYANGYRVLPIMSATELLWINKITDETIKQSLLIRDYDLQFIDENRVTPDLKIDTYALTHGERTCEQKINKIDYIRGAKECRDDEGNVLFYKCFPFTDNTDTNPFWEIFEENKTYFISKGDKCLKIDVGKKPFDEKHMNDDGEKNGILYLRGLKKPVEGIYASVQTIKPVKIRYGESRDTNAFVTRRLDGEGHSCPLNIYGIARSMVHRAEEYFKEGGHRLAALVAGEALEVLNGFHKSLMYQAYYVLAVSENALAMSLLGGDEQILRKDVSFRLNVKVKEDIKRMIPDEDDRYNLYYNIYNDCMLFCQEKEYFNAADEALSAMVHEKDKSFISRWVSEKIQSWRKKRK